MEEKTEGVVRGMRYDFPRNQIEEGLFVTANRVIVARKSYGEFYKLIDAIGTGINPVRGTKKEKELRRLSPEEVLKLDKDNYAILKSEITEVKLWKSLGLVKLRIKTSEKDYPKWNCRGATPKTAPKRGFEIEDYEAILRPVFGDNLSIKKFDWPLMASGWAFLLVSFLVNFHFLVNGWPMQYNGWATWMNPPLEGYVVLLVVLLIGGLLINHTHFRKPWIIGVPWIIGATLILAGFSYLIFLSLSIY